ncbi:hypothetical protein DD238_006156 [Peronospora effusa]|uniref:Uncharacterized protein n=1 Tax=Peronospora effusa TaxID=542832 RepID=A0A3M6V8B0_9STRA|nr:hypothetical protein DD238_006156 [Peronospora effusa]
MHQQEHRRTSPETRDDNDAPRIPRLLPSRAVFTNERTADCLLGLLASHADKQVPLIDERELVRRRQQTTENSLPVTSIEAASSVMHPATLQRNEERQQKDSRIIINDSNNSCIEDKASLASPLVAFLGQYNKCGSPRLPDTATSPRSAWNESPLSEQLDATASSRPNITSTSRFAPTPPTTSSWRVHSLLSPDPTVIMQSHNSHKRRTPASSSPQKQTGVTMSATKRPRLVRRVSSHWRKELFPRDRAQTRERILRSLHSHSQGDYETLVLILSSMEEELLHIKTTSSDIYTQQAFDLSNLIEHATLER